MRSKGTAAELEGRRCLAVRRVAEGYSAEEAAFGASGTAPTSPCRGNYFPEPQ